MIQTLRVGGAIDFTPFLKNRDQVLLNKVIGALSSDEWFSQFQFVAWFCEWLNGISRWIGGCDCHNDDLVAGRAVVCNRKGRRITTAYAFATSKLREGFVTANSWTMHTYLGGFTMLQAVQGCVRYVFNVGLVKLDFFDRIPILFGRLKEPEVRARCIEQWEASSKKDEASAEFMDEQGPLRDDVDAMNDDGTNVSVKLDAAIQGIKDIPLDDTVGEGPQAVANAISQRSRGCTWAWTASTMRLAQNLVDAIDLPPAVDTTLELQWHLFKNVVQLPVGMLQDQRG